MRKIKLDLSKYLWVIGLLFFSIQMGNIIGVTYYRASDQNTIQFPHKKSGSEPTRWHNVLDLNRWDSAHYERIVNLGYRNPDDLSKPLSTIQWFPGYPLVAKSLTYITSISPTKAFSWLSFISSFLFWMFLWSQSLYKILGPKVLLVTSVSILCWPGLVFWFAGMTEPVIALLSTIILRQILANKSYGSTAVIAFATSIKQVFVPIALATLIIKILEDSSQFKKSILQFIGSMAGLLIFLAYCQYAFNDPFASFNMQIQNYQKEVSLLNLFDLKHFSKYFRYRDGFIAFSSLLFLLGVFLKMDILKVTITAIRSREPQRMDPEIVCWWLAMACTSFYVMGNAHDQNPFSSLMRYQTSNIFIFILFGYQFKNINWYKIAFFLIPIWYLGYYWRDRFIVSYWNWAWVS